MSDALSHPLVNKELDHDNTSGCSAMTPGIYYPPQSKEPSSCFRLERIMMKNGELNIEQMNQRRTSRLSNWLLTIVEARFKLTIIFGLVVLFGVWVVFALIYWIIALLHGDLREENLPPYQNFTDWIPCTENNYGFTSSLILSAEIYWHRDFGKQILTSKCSETMITICLHTTLNLILQSFLVGVLFAKLMRPKNKTRNVEFTKKAVINSRDEKICLIFQISDLRSSPETKILNIKPSLFITRYEEDADVNEFDQKALHCTISEYESNLFLWPLTVIHIIDEASPLYKISAADFLCNKMEVLAVIEGMIESTGQLFQARTSYTESEIIWGHRFVSMVTYDERQRMNYVDYAKFNKTVKVDTPLCSAWELNFIVEKINKIEKM